MSQTRRRSAASPHRLLRRLFGEYRLALAVLTFVAILASLAESLGIGLIVLLVQSLLGNGTNAAVGGPFLTSLAVVTDHLLGLTAGALTATVALLIVVRAACSTLSALLTSALRHRLSAEVRERVYSEYLRRPYAWLRARDTAELYNILSSDSWAVADSFLIIIRVITNICNVIVFSMVILTISWEIALMAALGSLVAFLLASPSGRRAIPLGNESVRANAVLTDTILSGMNGMRSIRAFAQEERAEADFQMASQHARRAFTAVDRLFAILGPANDLIHILLLTAIVVLASALGVPGASILAAVILLYRLQPSLRDLEANRLAMGGHDGSLRLVANVLDAREASYPREGHVAIDRFEGVLTFRDVGFTYGTEAPDILEGFNLSLSLRGVTVLNGPSGSGKTTIVNLLLRLYEPSAGTITFNDTPLSDIKRADWFRHIALAGQDADLIVGSIRDNIRLSCPDASAEDVDRAADLAGVSAFTDDLPHGLDAPVGDRGINLSGGQRQRVGLARALLREPSLLILDEATSAIEEELESRIVDRIRAHFSDRAILLISHRATLHRDGDTIISLKE